jgi:hypothetical protein
MRSDRNEFGRSRKSDFNKPNNACYDLIGRYVTEDSKALKQSYAGLFVLILLDVIK